MIDVVILVGGKGTRLAPLTDYTPKPLVELNGRPILDYVIDRLPLDRVGKIVLAAGHMASKFTEYATELESRINKPVLISVERQPLLSAGAVRLALTKLEGNNPVMVMNGDIVTDIDLELLISKYNRCRPNVIFASVFQADATRFGTIITDEYNNVVSFEEKNPNRYRTYINSGILIFKRSTLEKLVPLEMPMSYERELIPYMIENNDRYAVCAIKYDNCYFNDIADVNALANCEAYLHSNK